LRNFKTQSQLKALSRPPGQAAVRKSGIAIEIRYWDFFDFQKIGLMLQQSIRFQADIVVNCQGKN
jgi:hypothetical protein